MICKLSDLVGILPFYYNWIGEKKEVSFETKLKIISAIGFDIDESLSYWIEYFETYPWKKFLEPVYVVEKLSPIFFVYQKQGVNCRFEVEISPFEELGIKAEKLKLFFSLDKLRVVKQKKLNNQTYFKYSVSIPPLSIGYYKMHVYSDKFSAESLLIVIPEECYTAFENKTLVIHCNIWSLRGSEREGDFSHVKKIAEHVNLSGGFISINPLHLNDPEDILGISPYSAVSRQFKTPLYLSICPVNEENQRFFEYNKAWKEKIKCLSDLFSSTDQDKEFVEYKNSLCPALRQDLKYFAVFCFLREKFGKNWQSWDERLRNFDTVILDKIYNENQKDVVFYEYLQWLIEKDLQQIDNLCSDLGFGSVKSSFDVWSNQELYALTAEYGAPPDDFNPKGQKWGFPAIIPFKLKEKAYLPFIKILRANMKTKLLRIDHALGLFRAFWIPEGDTAQDGAYVKYPWKDLLGIVLLESHLNKTGVIGEDLGTTEEWMREELIKRKIQSWKVFYFEKDFSGFKKSDLYLKNSLCSITTHDLPTFVGYWKCKDIKLRKEFSIFDESQFKKALLERQRDKEEIIKLLKTEGLLYEEKFNIEEILLAIVKFLAKTQSRYLLLYLEDILFVEEQTNFPGTITEHPNWQRKLPLTVDEILKSPIFKKIFSILKETGRIFLWSFLLL